MPTAALCQRRISVADRRDVAVLLVLLVVAVIPFLEVLLAPDSTIYNHDIDYFFAHEQVLRLALDGNDFPLWNPYFGGGSPGLGRIQVGLFYLPAAVMRAFLPVVTMFNLEAIIHVFLAGLGLYVVLRALSLERPGAAFGSVAFMLSGVIIPRTLAGHASVLRSIVWVGWLLYAYRRMLLRPSWANCLLTTVFTSLTLLGGHPQMSFTALLVPACYFCFGFLPTRLRNKETSQLLAGIGWSIATMGLSIGLVAVQWVPYAEWLTKTARGTGTAFDSVEMITRNSFHVEHFITQLLPTLWFDVETGGSIHVTHRAHFWEVSPFVGVTTLAIIVAGLAVRVKIERGLSFFLAGLGLMGLVFSLGKINPVYRLAYENSVSVLRAPGRFLLLWSFALVGHLTCKSPFFDYGTPRASYGAPSASPRAT